MIPLYLDKSAPVAIHGVTTPTGHNIKNPLTFASSPSIILNDPTDDQDDMYDVEDVSIQSVWDETVEPNADRDGSISGPPREMQKIISIRGFVRAGSLAELTDKINTLNRAFNPVLNYLNDTADPNRGFIPLKFAMPTTDTTSWPNGYSLQQYYVRPVRLPVPVATKFDDFNARFNVVLRAADPRRYEQSEQTATRTGDGNVTVANTLATYPSWPTIELDFTTGASGDITIYRSNSQDGSVLIEADELASSAGKILVIDYENKTCEYSDGTNKIAAVKATSRFQEVLPATSNTWVFSGLPANCDVTITWRRAFA